MNVLIVESPGKVKAINKYLGSNYKVLASFGHIRDLPSKDGSVKPDDDFSMVWDVDARAASKIKDIAAAVKGADKLILATDPDREGEAISWHILEVLKQKNALGKMPVERVVFNAITKIRGPGSHRPSPRRSTRNWSMPIWRAARWTIWSASPCRRCCGASCRARARPAACRSVALRLVVEREQEIEAFKAQEYWSIDADLAAAERQFRRPADPAGRQEARKAVAGQRSRRDARRRRDQARRHSRSAASRAKPVKRNPSPPFITSTLQQEACRKLGFNAKRTMQIAQGLYEGVEIGGDTTGLITYMRTDGITMVAEAITEARERHRQEVWRALCAAARRASIPARPRTPRKPMKRCAPPASPARRKRWRAISMAMRPSSTN